MGSQAWYNDLDRDVDGEIMKIQNSNGLPMVVVEFPHFGKTVRAE
jgi:hypothetical protein